MEERIFKRFPSLPHHLPSPRLEVHSSRCITETCFWGLIAPSFLELLSTLRMKQKGPEKKHKTREPYPITRTQLLVPPGHAQCLSLYPLPQTALQWQHVTRAPIIRTRRWLSALGPQDWQPELTWAGLREPEHGSDKRQPWCSTVSSWTVPQL